MSKNYKTKDSVGGPGDVPAALECVRECVTPGLGAGSWAPGDKVTDPELVRILAFSPYFKPSEVK